MDGAPAKESPHGSASKSLTGLMLPELVSARVAAMDGAPAKESPHGSASKSPTILTDMSTWPEPGARQRRGSGQDGLP